MRSDSFNLIIKKKQKKNVGCKKKRKELLKMLSNHLACKQIVSPKFSNPEHSDILQQRKNVNVHYEISKISSKGKIQSIFCLRRPGKKATDFEFSKL